MTTDFTFLPKRWECISLRETGKWLSGGTPSRSNSSYWTNGEDGIPWLGSKDVVTFDLLDSQEHITEAGSENGTRLVPKGTIIFVVRGMSLAKEFRVGVSGRQVAFNQDLKAIAPIAEILPSFLGRYLRYVGPRILMRVDTATHGTKRLPLERIEDLPVPVPGLKEQERIANALAKAEQIQRAHLAAAGLAGQLLDSLSQSAFRGAV